MMAPGEATGLSATRQSHWMSSWLERGCSEGPPEGASSAHRLLSAPYWGGLHRFQLLPCWSAAEWRPPGLLCRLPHALGLEGPLLNGRLSQ